MRKKTGRLFWVLMTVIPVIGLIFSLTDPKEFENIQAVWRDRIAIFGIFGPLVFVLIQADQVILTPISHYTVGAIGGFLYGPYIGGVLNWTGRVFGHVIAFEIARRFGRKVVEKFVDEKTIKQFDRFVSGKDQKGITPQSLILFLIYFLPLFPDDEISYIVGLSTMSRRHFILANLFGHVGGALSLAYIGSGVDTSDLYFWILFVITLLGFPIIWYVMRRHIEVNTQSNK